MEPHKWAKEIKAWADGAEIEVRTETLPFWKSVECPAWADREGVEYRIKPKTRKAIIDGVEYVLPESMKEAGYGHFVYSDGVISAGSYIAGKAETLSRCFATREDAELFAKAEKALRGIL